MKIYYRKLAFAAALLAAGATTVAGVTSCSGKGGTGGSSEGIKRGTYRTYTTVMPSNWNALTYQDNNDTQILDYIGSSFFEYDYRFDEAQGGKFNADGTVNASAIVEGGFEVKNSAATALEDVTASVDDKWGYTGEQRRAGGYAWKITLRNDLKWDDGTPIAASDFVYSMEQQLDPLFFNFRASTYYNNIRILNARNYLYSTTAETYETLSSQGYASVQEARDAGQKLYIDVDATWGMRGAQKVLSYDAASGEVNLDSSVTLGQWAEITDQTLFLDPAYQFGEDDLTDYILSPAQIFDYMWNNYSSLMEVGGQYEEWLSIKVANENMGTKFSDVGIYSPSEYEIVLCLEKPVQYLKEDGSLSYLAAYSLSLPLVKQELYEKCKQEPLSGSTLWTTNYNSSLATSASWGPYKLKSFQGGKSYALERNESWFGYGLSDNANQYNVTTIECEAISELNTQWLGFFGGSLDEIALDVTHKDDYRNSKYTYFAPGTGTFGINLYAGLDVLKTSGRNNGLLAIDDFRKAVSLFIDRDDYNATCYTSHRSCYGLLGPSYYYDVENGGVYRDTEYAKKALLRVYGFTEGENGAWTDGSRNYSTYEDAYEAMNGYNPTLARQLVNRAYEELAARAEVYGYDSSKPITLVYGTSADNENTRRNYNYIASLITELVKTTPLEGKITVKFDASFGSSWANDFRAGAYEIAAGTGFSGGAFDPEGFLQCYVDPEAQLMYSTWWDTASDFIEYTMPEGDYEGAGKILTMSVLNWYRCLNGTAESTDRYAYNWGAGAIPESARMQLLALLEEYILNKYYTVITTSEYSATLLGAKFSYITDEYNEFMKFGGYRYLIVNYTDSEWGNFVRANNNDLSAEYKKSA